MLVPLIAVFLVDYFGTAPPPDWDVSATAPGPAADARRRGCSGFVVYQLINPGGIGWWARAWAHVDGWLHLTVATWMSASLLSFAVAALATVPSVVGRGAAAHAAPGEVVLPR